MPVPATMPSASSCEEGPDRGRALDDLVRVVLAVEAAVRRPCPGVAGRGEHPDAPAVAVGDVEGMACVRVPALDDLCLAVAIEVGECRGGEDRGGLEPGKARKDLARACPEGVEVLTERAADDGGRALQIADGKSRLDTTGGCNARRVADRRVPQQGAVSSEGVVATCVGIGCAARADIDRRAVHRWRRLDRDVPDPHRPVGDLLAMGEVQRVEIAAEVANDNNRCSFEVCENRRGHGDRGGSIDGLLPGRRENDGCVLRMAVAPDRCRKGRGCREGEGSGCCECPKACSKSGAARCVLFLIFVMGLCSGCGAPRGRACARLAMVGTRSDALAGRARMSLGRALPELPVFRTRTGGARASSALWNQSIGVWPSRRLYLTAKMLRSGTIRHKQRQRCATWQSGGSKVRVPSPPPTRKLSETQRFGS